MFTKYLRAIVYMTFIEYTGFDVVTQDGVVRSMTYPEGIRGRDADPRGLPPLGSGPPRTRHPLPPLHSHTSQPVVPSNSGIEGKVYKVGSGWSSNGEGG